MTRVGQWVVFQVDFFEAATVLQILIVDLRYEVTLGVDVCDGLHLEQHARDLHEVVGGDVYRGEVGAGGQLPGQRGQLVAGHGQGGIGAGGGVGEGFGGEPRGAGGVWEGARAASSSFSDWCRSRIFL